VTDAFTDDDLRKAFWVSCESKVDLHQWIKVFLGLDLPDCIVDEDSTSSPMDFVWEVYDAAMKGNRPELTRILAYSSRDSFKTVAAAILECLAIVHMRRSSCHLAAVESQASKAQRYVHDYFRRPIFKDYVFSQNVRRMEFVHYLNSKVGDHFSESDIKAMDKNPDGLERLENYIQIIIATIQGTNSEHVNFMCIAGDSQILIKSLEGSKRDRVARTARGIFNRLAGKNFGGRPGGETKEEVTDPKNNIEVLSINLGSGEFEFKRIIRAHRDFKRVIEVRAGDTKLTCTYDHPLYVLGKGFVPAEKLKSGDRLLAAGKLQCLTPKTSRIVEGSRGLSISTAEGEDPWEQVVLGSLLGDCGIYKKPSNNPYLKEQHCIEQKDYMEWKRSIINNKLRTVDTDCASGYTGVPQVGFRSGCSPILLPFLEIRKNLNGIERLGPLGLAVWYQDDGCSGNQLRLSTECFSLEQNQFLSNFLERKFGIQTVVGDYTRDGITYFYLRGPMESKRRLVEICKPHIHPTMAYKFDLKGNTGECRVCGSDFWFYESGSASNTCGSPLCQRIKKVRDLPEITSVSAAGEQWVYDFTVEGNHNFFAEGVLNKNCVDEVDVVQNVKAYEEAKLIPSPFEGKLPITVLVSTRKTAIGLVQKEIDEAEQTGLQVRHWNIIDVTEACPATRHRPDEPRVDLWRSDEELNHTDEAGYKLLDSEVQKKYVQQKGVFAGCAKCPIFSSCKTRLATAQKSLSPLLKPIPHIINKFREVDTEMAQAQLMSRKAASTGLIYHRFDPRIHLLTAAQMAEKLTGDKYSPNFTKADLITLMLAQGLNFYAGLDWGFSHEYAVVSGAQQGLNLFIFDVIAITGLDPEEKLEHTQRVKLWNPVIFGDPEAPDQIKLFKKKGFQMRDWSKGPGSVKMGIDIVRMKLRPAIGDPHLFLLKDDTKCQYAAERLSKYHFKFDAAGDPTEVPDDEDDDVPDAIRYLVMNLFIPKGRVTAVDETRTPPPVEVAPGALPTVDNYMQHFIQQHLGQSDDQVGKKGKKGRIIWSLD